MRGHRIERTIRLVGHAGLAVGMGMILVAGVVSIASAQAQLAANPQAATAAIERFEGRGLDLDLPDMPFAQRPAAAKSVEPDRWAWIEGCRRFVDARIARDVAIDREIGASTRPIARTAEAESYRHRRLLADCLASRRR